MARAWWFGMQGHFSFWSWSALVALACGGTTDTGQQAFAGATYDTGGTAGTGGHAGTGGNTATGGSGLLGTGPDGGAPSGGSVGTGGSATFDPGCPSKVPAVGTACNAEGMVCAYSYFSSCLCTTNAQYGCVQVDVNCTATQSSGAADIAYFPSGGSAGFAAPPTGGAAAGIPAQSGGAVTKLPPATGGTASAVALPPNHQCNCLNGVWACLY
jgi:hypothetical protein